MKNKYSLIIFLVGVISGILYILFHNTAPLAVTMIFKTLPSISMCTWMILKTLDKINIFIFIGLLLSLACDVFMLLNLVTPEKLVFEGEDDGCIPEYFSKVG